LLRVGQLPVHYVVVVRLKPSMSEWEKMLLEKEMLPNGRAIYEVLVRLLKCWFQFQLVFVVYMVILSLFF
jgi:hypothetical protein